MKTEKLLTKQSLQKMLDSDNKNYVIAVIGKALVILMNNQTRDEVLASTTIEGNGIGFTGCDARTGTITAKSYLKSGTLADWQLEKWLKKDKNGYSRLSKYHGQLNVAANNKKK